MGHLSFKVTRGTNAYFEKYPYRYHSLLNTKERGSADTHTAAGALGYQGAGSEHNMKRPETSHKDQHPEAVGNLERLLTTHLYQHRRGQ